MPRPLNKDTTKKVLLALLAILLGWAAMSNFVHALGIFLLDLGPEQLPFSILSVSGFLLLNSFLGVIAAERVKADKIFSATIIFFVANYAALLLLPQGTFLHSFYFFVIAFLVLWLQEGMLTQLVSSIFTPLQSKRYLPFVFGFMNLGLVLGALFIEPYKLIHEFLGVGTLPIASFVLILVLMSIVGRVYRRELSHSLAEAHKAKLLHEIVSTLKYIVKGSRLLWLIAIGVMLFAGLHISIDFKLKTVFAETFGHGTLTENLGLVYMVRSLLAWLMSALAVRKLLFHYGVSNMMIFYPLSVLAFAVLFPFFHLHYLAATALFLVFSLSYYSYYDICISQMLSIVPKQKEHAVHFLIHGFLYSLGMIVFSLILLIYTHNIALETTINTIVIILVSATLVYLFLQAKKYYLNELKKDLYSEDEFLKLRAIDLFAEASSMQSGEDYLRRMLELSNLKGHVKARVLGSLGVIGNYQTIVDLAKVLKDDPNPKMKTEAIHAINTIIKEEKDLESFPVTKHYLLRTYENMLLSDAPNYVKTEIVSALKYFDLEDVMTFLEERLYDKDVQIQKNVLKTLAGFHDRGIIPYLEPFLQEEDLGLLSEAIMGLWQFEELRVKILPRIASLIVQRDEKAVESTLNIIGSIKASWEKRYVHEQLEHKKPHVRLHALITLIELGETDHVPELLKTMLSFAKKGKIGELDFILAHYRVFPKPVKNGIIRTIQEMKDTDSKVLCDAFKESKFVLSQEIAELS